MPEIPIWMEIRLDDRPGDGLHVSARSSRDEEIAPRPLGSGLDARALSHFTASVRQAAERGQPLGPALAEKAQALHQALLDKDIGKLHARLLEAAGGRLLVRLVVDDHELRALPWEAACKPGESLGFWGSAPDLLPVRGVISSDPLWQPHEVRGAVRVLAIAPEGGRALAFLQSALAEPMASGEVEWLEPIEGRAAQVTHLFNRLRREPMPHVLHFLGHGHVDAQGRPLLRLADRGEDEEHWLPVELLARHLQAHARGVLRLVVLEACEGAAPSVFASAAETLVRGGADAALAHLWSVKADIARVCSTQFYRALAGTSRGGDVALSLNEARRVMLATSEASAQAFSPVLYLRARDSKLFDFAGRKVTPPSKVRAVPTTTARSGSAPALARLLGSPFSLLLGDRWADEREVRAGFRGKLCEGLKKASDPAPDGMPMGALAQRYAFRKGRDSLFDKFQEAFSDCAAGPRIISALSRALCPGLHTVLLRHPWLEQSLVEERLGQTIQVVHSDGTRARVMRCRGGDDWENDSPLAEIDTTHDIILLRPYRGYTRPRVFSTPLLTEDHYHQLGLTAPWGKLPPDLDNRFSRLVNYRPALIAGVSLLTAHHRWLLYSLYARGLPTGSLVVLEPGNNERELWESGDGLPDRWGGVEVVEMPSEALEEAIGAVAVEAVL